MLKVNKHPNSCFIPSTLVLNTSCDFDRGLCGGWRQSNADIFEWKRHTGSTPSNDTGPDYDHASGSGENNASHL